MVTKGDDGRFYKDCPQCGETQSYLRKGYAEESLRLGKVCKTCANRTPESKAHKGYYKGVLRAAFAHKYKTGAETRGIEWSLEWDEMADLLIDQDFRCTLSGLPLSAMELNNEASLDRIDSDYGYVTGNVQWVHKDINFMKQQFGQEHFITMCRQVAENACRADKTKW